MSLPRSYRRLDARCLLLVVAAFASNAQALNVSAGTATRRTESVEVASVADAPLLPSRSPVNTDAVPSLTEEAQSNDGAQVFVASRNRRGQCWKLPARATLAAFEISGASDLFRRPAIFWMDIKEGDNAHGITRVRALRPVCLMPLPFTPDRKNNARQLAAVRKPIFRAS